MKGRIVSAIGFAEYLLELALQDAEEKFGHKFAPLGAQCSQCSERAVYAVETELFLCSLHHHVWLHQSKETRHE